MATARVALAFFVKALIGSVCWASHQGAVSMSRTVDVSWRQHPALAKPDGQSGRGGRMVAADVDDPRFLAELSRQFRQAYAGNLETEQEYFLRLLDYYVFTKKRLVGMTRAEVDAIFGPLHVDAKDGSPDAGFINGGRDALQVGFVNGRVSGTNYSMGY
jgi:hypothetical protein